MFDSDEEEQLVKKSRVSAAKKTTKTKKDKKYVLLACFSSLLTSDIYRTSADRDAEDKAAKAVAKKNMTLYVLIYSS